MTDLNPFGCPACDFGMGRRGMDRCSKCDGTGSGFYIGRKFFPNTKEGHDAALAKLSVKGSSEDE